MKIKLFQKKFLFTFLTIATIVFVGNAFYIHKNTSISQELSIHSTSVYGKNSAKTIAASCGYGSDTSHGETYGINCGGTCPPGQVFNGSSCVPEQVPPPPIGVSSSCSNHTLTVNWNNPGATYVQVRVFDNETGIMVGRDDNRSPTSPFTVSGLYGSHYDSWVHSCNSAGCSNDATHASIVDCAAPPPTCPNSAINPPSCNQCGSNSAMKNGQCLICQNGGCTNNQCNNGATNAPDCNQCPSGQLVLGGKCVTPITEFKVTTDYVNPNGFTEFSWRLNIPSDVGSRCGFVDLTTATPRPIPGLQNLDPGTEKVRISNIQATTRFCLVCQFYSLINNASLGNSALHQWIRVIRIGEN